MTWAEFDSGFALSVAEYCDRRERLLVASVDLGKGADGRRVFGRESLWWDKFVDALQWALSTAEAEYSAEDFTWKFQEFEDICYVEHWRKQLGQAQDWQAWAHKQIRRLYGRF